MLTCALSRISLHHALARSDTGSKRLTVGNGARSDAEAGQVRSGPVQVKLSRVELSRAKPSRDIASFRRLRLKVKVVWLSFVAHAFGAAFQEDGDKLPSLLLLLLLLRRVQGQEEDFENATKCG